MSDGRLPPGNDPRQPMAPHWLSTQLATSGALGLGALLLFVVARRRFPRFYAPASPAPVPAHEHASTTLLGWVRPLWAFDERAHPAAVTMHGLVLLDFLRTAAQIFLGLSLWSVAVTMPTNWLKFGTLDGVPPETDGNTTLAPPFLRAHGPSQPQPPQQQLLLLLHEGPLPIKPQPGMPAPQRFNIIHVITEVVFTSFVLAMLFAASRRVSRVNQEYNVRAATQGARIATLPARTVEIRQIPHASYNAQSMRTLLSHMSFHPDHLSFVRDPTHLQIALAQRALAKMRLESAWKGFLLNRYAADPHGPHPGPAAFDHSYDPRLILRAIERDWKNYLAQQRDVESAPQSAQQSIADDEQPLLSSGEGNPSEEPEVDTDSDDTTPPSLNPVTDSGNTPGTDAILQLLSDPLYVSRKRPWSRALWWNLLSPSVDELPHLQLLFFQAHYKVLKERWRMLDPVPLMAPTTRERRKAGTGVAFVTLCCASEAQVLAQTLYAEEPGTFLTRLASGPGEVVWTNVNMGVISKQIRSHFVSFLVFLILLFYIPPLLALLSLVNDVPLDKYIPGLAYFFRHHPRLHALFQGSLPSLVLVSWNAFLPALFESLAYVAGARDTAQIQLSVFQRYYSYLVVSVVFIALVATSAWALIEELWKNPEGFLSHLGSVLPIARSFSTAYVILQAFGLVPLQLLCLPTACRALWAHWTSDTDEPAREVLYPGTIYPQILIVFTLAILYANVAPRITIFALVYFVLLYAVVKYKLLFMHASASSNPAPPPMPAETDAPRDATNRAAVTSSASSLSRATASTSDDPGTSASENSDEETLLDEARAWATGAGKMHAQAVGRCVWALLLYQVFQLSQVLVRKQTLLALLHVPLLLGTALAWNYLTNLMGPSELFTNIASLRHAEAAAATTASQPMPTPTLPPTLTPTHAPPADGPTYPTSSLTATHSTTKTFKPGAALGADAKRTGFGPGIDPGKDYGTDAGAGTPPWSTESDPNYTLRLYRHPALDESPALPVLGLPKPKHA